MKQSAMGSSKYEFEPELFEKDIRNKKELAEQFKTELEKVIYQDYYYHNGMEMSDKAKREILIEIHRRFIGRG